FSMIVSDTTGNVKRCRKLVCAKWPWILNCPDPCHQLNLMMKDVILGSKKYPKIKGFAEPMRIVSAITTYFSHSNYGKHHLQQELKNDISHRGIIAGGATRFSTFHTHVCSILRCFDAMERCLSRGLLIFDTPATKELRKYIVYGTDRLKLQIQLNHIDALLHPIARGLTTLEGQNTTCSDVFYVFIGIAIGFNRVFEDPTSDIYQYRTETFGVFDRRFGIFLNDCTKDMFIISYLLDPSENLVHFVVTFTQFYFSVLSRWCFAFGASPTISIFTKNMLKASSSTDFISD
ncbi:hypothetical protein DFH05DRAFT_1404969, partial [Lentinula detonsa]